MKAYHVNYTVQVKPGDTTRYSNACSQAGPFSSRAAAEQFAIQLAARMPLLECEIAATEIDDDDN